MNLILWQFLIKNFAYALNANPEAEFSEEEYNIAKEALQADLKNFKKDEQEMVIQSLACLVKSLKCHKYAIEGYKDSSLEEKAKSYKQYHKMILELHKVINSLAYGEFITKEQSYFNVTKITFEGAKQKEKIVLKGEILEIIKDVFQPFLDLQTKESKQKMKEFSRSYYQAYEEYYKELVILTAEEAPLAKRRKKILEEDSKQDLIAITKKDAAFYCHIFFKNKSIKQTDGVPSWHTRIIAKLFNKVGLIEYLGDSEGEDVDTLKTINNWIKRA